jgi:glucuronokinase
VSISPSEDDTPSWSDLRALSSHCDRYGYTGGVPLIQAVLAAYAEFVFAAGLEPLERGFRIAYRSSIPRQVGLAGSSALAVATLRAVVQHHGVEVETELIPSLALAAETRLGITAGLQDRVAQTYGGVVAMDFRHRKMQHRHGLAVGGYRFLDPAGLPPLYIAWSPEVAAESRTFHSDLRARFEAGEWAVTSGMKMLGNLAEQAEYAINVADHDGLGELIDHSFDLRRRMATLPAGQEAMVDRARKVGVSATFAGSGGAIVGSFRGIEQLNELQARLEPTGATVRRLEVAPEFGA